MRVLYALESRLRKKVPEFAKPDDVSPVDERVEGLQHCGRYS